MLETRTTDLGGVLRLFSDPTRLRILALLELEELSVGELSRALDLSQSRVSNHLRVLRDAGLLRERRVGTSTFLRPDRPQNGERVTGRLWKALQPELEAVPEHSADRVRLASVLEERRGTQDAFFDRLAGEWDKLAGAFETGRARERAAAHLLPAGYVVADLGCGTGYMGSALLANCAKLICVDASEKMLAEARERLSPAAQKTEVELRRGDLDALPIETAELDGLVAGMVLHHLPSLDTCVAEMFRVLKPGASASILELGPHREEWMRRELGDLHLGLEPTEVLSALERAGFTDLVLDPVEDRYRPSRLDAEAAGETVSLSLYIVRGRKPAHPDTIR